jgi:cytochrome c oxidase subunit IV
MGHSHGLSPEEQRKEDIKVGTVGFGILLLITLGEVGVALIGNGHLIDGVSLPSWFMIPTMIAMSLYKAYYIVSIFMHLGHEVGGMAYTIVMPMFLLVWGVIAFLWEGEHARHNRNYVKDARPAVEQPTEESAPETGMLPNEELSKQLSFK